MTGTLLLAWAALAVLVFHGLRLVATVIAARRAPAKLCPAADGASVTVVRPFIGIDEDGRAKHLTLLRQRYRPLEVVFACESEQDAGIPAVRAACDEERGRGRLVLAGSDASIGSGKARNMIAGWRASRSPLVAFCDADIALDPDDVGRCVALFEDPRVGAVFMPCLFDAPGIAGRLVMFTATVDSSVLVQAAARIDRLPLLQGGLMVIRRSALEAAGGIEVVADAIADDMRLGRVLRRAGFVLRATEQPIVHRSGREGPLAWAARYHRWMMCQRSEAPGGFWLMLALHPLVAPLLAALAVPAPLRPIAWTLLGLGSLVELAYTAFVERRFLRPDGLRLGWWVLARPVADLAHFALCLAALVWPVVSWRGRRYFVGPSGRIVARELERCPPVSSAAVGE